MGMSDKFRCGDGWQTIATVEMWDNKDRGNIDTGRWMRRQRRRGVGDRRDTGQWR